MLHENTNRLIHFKIGGVNAAVATFGGHVVSRLVIDVILVNFALVNEELRRDLEVDLRDVLDKSVVDLLV